MSMVKLTKAQLDMACDFGMGEPVPFKKADVTESFVYSRKYGFFYVLPCHHQKSMALFYAWDHGQEDPFRWETKRIHGTNPHLYNASVEDMADYWVDGEQFMAYKSSVGKKIQLGGCGRPTTIEVRKFMMFDDYVLIGQRRCGKIDPDFGLKLDGLVKA
jgi:hypothetical protein